MFSKPIFSIEVTNIRKLENGRNAMTVKASGYKPFEAVSDQDVMTLKSSDGKYQVVLDVIAVEILGEKN